MKDVEVIQVVRTTLLRVGSGVDATSPTRRVTQYWSFGGELLAEVDPCSRTVTPEDDYAAVGRSRGAQGQEPNR
jgi:hypothetical protein